MLVSLKKFLSIFTIVVFLSPFVIEQVHAFEHLEDKHCTDTETHYCTPEHHCKLCDFVQLTSDSHDSEIQIKAELVLTANDIYFYQAVSFEHPKFNYSLRGPPAVS
jgi:hypothetical protein